MVHIELKGVVDVGVEDSNEKKCLKGKQLWDVLDPLPES